MRSKSLSVLQDHIEIREVLGGLQLTGLIAGAQSTFDRLLDRLCDCHLVNGCLRKAVKLMAIRLCGRENPKVLQSQSKL